MRVAIVGHGRSGKDTAAQFLASITSLRYTGSASDTVAPLVAWVRGESVDECFAHRHDIRPWWKDWCDRFRRGTDTALLEKLQGPPPPSEILHSSAYQALMEDPGLAARWDPAKIVRMHLRRADIVPGLRGGTELRVAREEGLLDLVIWVDNWRVPDDPTVEFHRDDADLVVLNETSLVKLYSRLRRLARCLRGITTRED